MDKIQQLQNLIGQLELEVLSWSIPPAPTQAADEIAGLARRATFLQGWLLMAIVSALAGTDTLALRRPDGGAEIQLSFDDDGDLRTWLSESLVAIAASVATFLQLADRLHANQQEVNDDTHS